MMKRIRRITVEIEQRRQRLTVHRDSAAAAPVPGSAADAAADFPRQPNGERMEACPRCGAPWVLLHEPDAAAADSSLPDLKSALASLDLHLQSTPGGRVWICRRTYDRLKETP